nr:hypothetical protein [Candidatus Cloacimonadota bacterium]
MKKILICIYIIIVIFISKQIIADYEQLPGFPYSTSLNAISAKMRGVGVVNINDDPFLEIVVSISDTTFSINYQGERLWAAYTPHDAQRTMSFADIDNDGYLEILQTTRSGWVYILDKEGNNYPGWPKYFGTPSPWYSYIISTPVAYDLDGDRIKEIIWGDFDHNYQSYLYVVDINGENYNDNFPFPISPGVSGGAPAIGDVDNDGIPEIVCMGYYDLFILKPDGSILNGWPQQPFDGNACYSITSPVLADLTGDSFLEIIVAASGPITTGTPSGLIIYKYDGTILNGWPQQFPFITNCPPSVADLDNDGTLEILCGRKGVYSHGYFLYIYNINGQLFLNAPYYSFGNVNGPIIIGDIDNIINKEIIFDSNFTGQNLGFIQGIHCNGDTINNFPLRPKGCTMLNSSVFGDINQDGLLDLTSYSYDFDSLWVYVYNLNVIYDPLQIEWKTYQYDFQRLGQYHPPFSFDPPTNVQASADSHGINLSWDQPANQRNYAYSIFRDDNLLARTPYTSFCDSLVQSYTTYHYYIQSVYEQGYSPSSEIIELTTDSIVSVDNLLPSNLSSINLSNFPNPFSTSTTISFNLATCLRQTTARQAKSHKMARIKIYNIKGQLVKQFKI